MKWKESKPYIKAGIKTRWFKSYVVIAAVITIARGAATGDGAAAVTAVLLWFGAYLIIISEK